MARELLLLLLFIALSTSDQCDMCPPGTYLVEKCKEGYPHTTRCKPCPSGTYTQYYNHLDYCLRHRHCAGRNIIVHPGNATTDTDCICKKGYRKPSHLEIELCLRNPLCPRGTSVTRRGNACRRCPRGFYSDHHSRTDLCRPWTNCTDHGLTVVAKGSRTRDVTCGHRNLTTDSWRNNGTNEGGVFITPPRLPDLQLNIGKVSPQPGTDPSVLKTSEYIVISLLCFLSTCATSLILFGLWVNCKNRRCRIRCKKQKLRHGVQVQQVSQELQDSGRSSYVGTVGHVQLRREENESSYETIPQPVQTSYKADPVFCLAVDNPRGYEGEYSTFPKTHQKSTPTAWSSCGSLPTVQDRATVLTRMKTESSEEYMHEMQRLIAEGYASVLSASGAEYLATELGPAWRQVAKRLGIKQDQIDHIWNENRQDLERQIFKMLCCWQRNRTGRASISELYGALLECNQETLCTQLKEMEHDSSSSEETKVYSL